MILIGSRSMPASSRELLWRRGVCPTPSLFSQVRATMLVTVFVFLGIEGASVYSRYAKKRSDVGAATIMGFIGVTSLMVLVTLLPYAVLKRAEIAGIRQPSMAGVLEAVVGPLGRRLHQPRPDRLGARRLPGVVADLRRGALRRRAEGGHAAGVRHREREQGAGSRPVADQHRGPVLRHHHVLVARTRSRWCST